MIRKLSKEEFLKKVRDHEKEKEKIGYFLAGRRNARRKLIETRRRRIT